jgi:hypothetical protein
MGIDDVFIFDYYNKEGDITYYIWNNMYLTLGWVGWVRSDAFVQVRSIL